MGYTTKEIAQACIDYVVPMCNSHYKDRLEVLEYMAKWIDKEILVIQSSDPARNR